MRSTRSAFPTLAYVCVYTSIHLPLFSSLYLMTQETRIFSLFTLHSDWLLWTAALDCWRKLYSFPLCPHPPPPPPPSTVAELRREAGLYSRNSIVSIVLRQFSRGAVTQYYRSHHLRLDSELFFHSFTDRLSPPFFKKEETLNRRVGGWVEKKWKCYFCLLRIWPSSRQTNMSVADGIIVV